MSLLLSGANDAIPYCGDTTERAARFPSPNINQRVQVENAFTRWNGTSWVTDTISGSVINVTDPQYGATGDGSTDDTTAVQAALTAAMNATIGVSFGATVYFPAGVYRITSKLTLAPTQGYVKLIGAGNGASVISTSFGGTPSADPTLELPGTGTAANLVIENLRFRGNNTAGAGNNGHAIAIVNRISGAGVSNFEPQRVTIRDCVIEGYRGVGKDESGASMTACGVYWQGGTVGLVENTQIFNCGKGVRLLNMFKVQFVAVTIDTCDETAAYIVTSENVGFHGSTLNSSGANGATDGLLYATGCEGIGFSVCRLKNGYPYTVNLSGASTTNRNLSFYACSIQQLDQAQGHTACAVGNGTEGIRFTDCNFKFVNTMTDAVGVDFIQAVSGRNPTGCVVEGCTFTIGDGGTITAMVRSNVTTNTMEGLQIRGNTFGAHQAAGSATTFTSAIDLRGNAADTLIESNSFVVSTNRTMTNAILMNAATVTGTLIRGNRYVAPAGTITNKINNAGAVQYTRQETAGLAGGGEQVLGVLVGANMNTTADQAITINAGTWLVTKILVTNASTSLTTAAGGVYPAASKAGTAIVAAGQVYSALTAAAKVLSLTIAAPDSLAVQTIYLSLTTGQGGAATADVRVFGYPIS